MNKHLLVLGILRRITSYNSGCVNTCLGRSLLLFTSFSWYCGRASSGKQRVCVVACFPLFSLVCCLPGAWY